MERMQGVLLHVKFCDVSPEDVDTFFVWSYWENL